MCEYSRVYLRVCLAIYIARTHRYAVVIPRVITVVC